MIKWFIINSHEIFSISWGWRLGWVGHGTGLSHWKIGSRSSRKWEMEKSGRVEKISISRSWIREWLSITKLCFFKPYPMCDKLCWNSSCYLVTTFFANRFPAGPPLRNAFGEVLRPLLRFIVILSPAWHEPVNQNRYFDKEQLILSANFSQLPDANMQKFQGVSFSAIFFCHLNTPSRHRREVLWGHSHSGSPVIQLVAVQLPAPRHQGRDWGNETWNRNGG